MPKLLVPTDFSNCSSVAARYAIELASALKLSVEFLHAYQVSRPAGSLINVEEHMQEGVQNDFDAFIEDLRQNNPHGVRLHKRTMQRNAVDAIDHITKLEGDEVAAVVMGTHGQSALEQLFVGSTTRKTIERIKHPVLAVPPLLAVDSHVPQRILWALDGKTNADSRGVRFVRELVAKPGGRLTFFHAGDSDELVAVEADILAGETTHNFYSVSADAQPANEIAAAVEDTNAELLVLSHRPRGFVESWIGGSTTAKLLRNANVPVLILNH